MNPIDTTQNIKPISPTINAEQIGNVEQIKIPEQQPQPNLLAGLSSQMQNTALESNKKEDTAFNDLINLQKQLEGQTAEQIQLQNEQNLPVLNRELLDLRQTAQKQQADYLAGYVQAEGQRNTRQETSAVQNSLNRQHAIDALLTNSLIASKEGNITFANSLVDRAITAKYDPIKQRIETQKSILQQVSGKAAEDRKNVLSLQLKQIDNEQELLNKGIENINTQIKEGKITTSAGYDAISNLVSGKTKPSEVYAKLGITGTGNPGIIAGVDISKYATDPQHEIKVASIYNSLPEFIDAKSIQNTISNLYPNSKITGDMILTASINNKVDPKLVFSIMAQDSSMGTAGIGARNFNPGNVGQFDNLGTTPTAGYKNWQEGVNAVAKWLSNHKATGIYNGEFGATLEASISGEPATLQKSKLQTLQNLIASKDYNSAYKQIGNSVSKSLTGENKTRYDAARIDINVLSNLQKTLQQYEDMGGDTGFLKGSVEQINRRFGQLKTDPKFAALAVQMEREFQAYRNQMTGAAFSPGESREYEAVNPTGKKSFDLNNAVITGAVNQLNSRIDSTISSVAGDGALNIKEYAQYQGLQPDDIVIKLSKDKPEIKSSIDKMIKNNLSGDVILEALGYQNLIK